jgi:hypothetical protein
MITVPRNRLNIFIIAEVAGLKGFILIKSYHIARAFSVRDPLWILREKLRFLGFVEKLIEKIKES